MKSIVLVGFAVVILVAAACNIPDAPPPDKRFSEEGFGHSRSIITDNETGCQFLYIDRYKMSGLAAIPGTCKADSAKKGQP